MEAGRREDEMNKPSSSTPIERGGITAVEGQEVVVLFDTFRWGVPDEWRI